MSGNVRSGFFRFVLVFSLLWISVCIGGTLVWLAGPPESRWALDKNPFTVEVLFVVVPILTAVQLFAFFDSAKIGVNPDSREKLAERVQVLAFLFVVVAGAAQILAEADPEAIEDFRKTISNNERYQLRDGVGRTVVLTMAYPVVVVKYLFNADILLYFLVLWVVYLVLSALDEMTTESIKMIEFKLSRAGGPKDSLIDNLVHLLAKVQYSGVSGSPNLNDGDMASDAKRRTGFIFFQMLRLVTFLAIALVVGKVYEATDSGHWVNFGNLAVMLFTTIFIIEITWILWPRSRVFKVLCVLLVIEDIALMTRYVQLGQGILALVFVLSTVLPWVGKTFGWVAFARDFRMGSEDIWNLVVGDVLDRQALEGALREKRAEHFQAKKPYVDWFFRNHAAILLYERSLLEIVDEFNQYGDDKQTLFDAGTDTGKGHLTV